ncbi:MAG: alpha/beta hydrolase [Pseudomonadota bacterium]
MQSETINVHGADGHLIPARLWRTTEPARGAVQILHGLGEHCDRYSGLAEKLNQAGLHVIAHDHRGHGEAIAVGTQGFFAERLGWQKVIDDVFAVRRHLDEAVGPLPVALLGHSMGSYIAQATMLRDATPWIGLALSGSNFAPRWLLYVARWVAKLERWRKGQRSPSKLMTKLSFGSYNKPFEPARTEFDWLSRDPNEVDRYINDPWCGFDSTGSLWVDLLGGLIGISSIKALRGLPGKMPVYIFGGAEDPISAGNRLEVLTQSLDAAGVENVVLTTYPGARHEVFNETNRAEVTTDFIRWLENLEPLRTENAA